MPHAGSPTVDGAGVVTVKYDGKTPWGTAVPYVQFSRDPVFYGGKWGQAVNITLNGEISLLAYDTTRTHPTFTTDLTYPEGLKSLEAIRDDIIEVFSTSLKTLEIKDTATPPNEMVFDNVIVEEIDFPASGYWGRMEFVVSLKCYELDYFMAQGIMDAVDEFSTTENENGTLTINHKISGRGFDYTDQNGDRQYGLNNVIAWVDTRKGSSHISREGIYQAWWGGTNSGYGPAKRPEVHLKLMSQDEAINRLEGTYEVTETFMGYLDEENNLVDRTFGRKFSVDINESLTSDFNVVTISGEYSGGKDTSLDELRDGFVNDNPTGNPALPAQPELMLFEKAKELSGFDGTLLVAPHPDAGNYHKPLLYNVPIGFNVEENETEKKIRVKATFDTNPLFVDDSGNPSRYFFNHKISVTMDELTNVTKVSVDGNLEVRGLSIEKQYYLKQFLEGQDVMNFLWKKADEQHALIGKTCWKCNGVNPETAVNEDYWIRADIGDADTAAGGSIDTICGNHPWKGTLVAGASAERCHSLNKSATSLSMVKNEVTNTLNLSASFNDEDTLEIKIQNDPADPNCFVCTYKADPLNPGTFTKIIYAADQAAADAECPQPDPFTKAEPCTVGEISTGKDYGKAAFNVDIKSPIDYAKANASAQAKYNGHWAVQNFGIKTRERSDVKVDLQFREDAGVPNEYLENTLRSQAKDIQTTLNSMFNQNYAGPIGGPVPSPVYDVSENISHKITKGDQLSHKLERSYQPDESKAICIKIDPIGDQKECFMCLQSGEIVTSSSLGSKVFVYPNSGYQSGVGYQYNQTTEAQALCDQMIGTLDVYGATIVGPLTLTGCTNCWDCWDEDGVWLAKVNETAQRDAWDAIAGSGSCPAGTHAALACDLTVSIDCYECWGGPNYDIKTHNEFETISQQTALDFCQGYQGLSDYSMEVQAKVCPPPEKTCWECFYDPSGGNAQVQGQNDFGWGYAEDEEDALEQCAGVYMSVFGVTPTGSISTVEGCDFQTFGTTTTTSTGAPTPP